MDPRFRVTVGVPKDPGSLRQTEMTTELVTGGAKIVTKCGKCGITEGNGTCDGFAERSGDETKTIGKCNEAELVESDLPLAAKLPANERRDREEEASYQTCVADHKAEARLVIE